MHEPPTKYAANAYGSLEIAIAFPQSAATLFFHCTKTALNGAARGYGVHVKRSRWVWLPALVGVVLAYGGTVMADDDVAALVKQGARAFNACRACHVIDAEADSTQGPNLWGVYGTKSAQRDDFDYSDPMKKANVVWNDATIEKWITNPKAFIPGTKMAYVGMVKPEDRKALIAFLKTKK